MIILNTKSPTHNINSLFLSGDNLSRTNFNYLLYKFFQNRPLSRYTYTHNSKLIYRSEDIFVTENILTAEKIKEVTGFYPRFVRFPGGSNKNTVKALPMIIEKYESEGYIFYPISDLTEEYYYRIRK